MSALVATDPVAALGLSVGAVGICMAVYLAWVSAHRVPWRYTAAFFGVGSLLVLTHTDPFTPMAVADTLRALAAILVAVVEVVAFRWVLQNTGVERPREVLESAAGEVRSFFP